jgi:beta-galactosidase
MATGIWGEAKAQMLAEQLSVQTDDVNVLMKYRAPHTWLDGQPAAVTRKVGQGAITYVGAWLDNGGMRRAVQWMLSDSNAHPDLFPVPAAVEVYRRLGGDREIFIVENYGQDEKTIELPATMTNLLTGETVQTVKLPLYGVAVLKKAASARP